MMRSRRLRGLIIAGWWTLPAAVLTCTLCWALISALLSELTTATGEKGDSVLWQSARTLLPPAWAEHLVSFLICTAIGYFLIEPNSRFSTIRMQTSMQTAIYFLLVIIYLEMHLPYAGNVVVITFLSFICFLFKNCQQSQTPGYPFYSFLFTDTGSVLLPQLTFFSVLWLFEAHRSQSLTLHSFCGALIGWTVLYWTLFGHAFFYDQTKLFYHPFKGLATFGGTFNLQILQPWELATLGYLLVLFVVSATHYVVAGFENKVRTRAHLQFPIDVTLFLSVPIVLQPSQCSNLSPLFVISNSILVNHLSVLANNKTSNTFFIIVTVYLILLSGFNVWTLL